VNSGCTSLSEWINGLFFIGSIHVPDPLRDIAEHVVESPRIGSLHANGVRTALLGWIGPPNPTFSRGSVRHFAVAHIPRDRLEFDDI
jgi:hypothetical protein